MRAGGIWVAALMGVSSCDGPAAVHAGEGLPRPDLLVACIDGIGPEHPLQGLPAFEKMRAEGVVYSAAHAPSPWAGESVAALIAGTLLTLPATDDGRSPNFSEATAVERAPSLPEVLVHAGYRTAFLPAHPLHLSAVDKRFAEVGGAGGVFQEIIEVPGASSLEGARAADVARAATEWLRSDKRPALLVLCFADPRPPHHLYTGLDLNDASGDYQGPVTSGLDHAELLRRAPSFTDADRARLAELHGSEVAAVELAFDSVAGSLMSRRRRPPILALVGIRRPALGEDGRYGLLPSLDFEALRVPMIVRFSTGIDGAPGPRGSTGVPATLVDLYPTLLDALALPPRLDLDGRSVFPGARSPSRPIVARTARGIRGEVVLDQSAVDPDPVPAPSGR